MKKIIVTIMLLSLFAVFYLSSTKRELLSVDSSLPENETNSLSKDNSVVIKGREVKDVRNTLGINEIESNFKKNN